MSQALATPKERLCFAADHPVKLQWTGASGTRLERSAQLRRVTDSALSVMLRQTITTDDALRIGIPIMAEAGVDRSSCLALIRGRVESIESRLIRIKINGGIEVRERRQFQRAQPRFPFATAVPLGRRGSRHFLVRPIDLGAGGIRIRHHADLRPGDRLQLNLKLKESVTITPIAEVIETWPDAAPGSDALPTRATFISRMAFVDLQPIQQRIIGSYVSWLLKAAR